MILKKIIIVFFAFAIIITSCDKPGCEDPSAINYNPKANSSDGSCQYDNFKPLFLETYHLYESNSFTLDSIYFDDFGTMIKFSRANFYLGKNCLYNSEGICYNDTLKYFLINPNEQIYNLGFFSPESSFGNNNFEPGISSLDGEFQVGVDSVYNHLDPALYPSDEPLSYQTPSMHWQMGANPQDWSYLFIVIEGFADLDSNGIFDPGETFVFHLGGDAFLSSILSYNCTVYDNTDGINYNGNLVSSYSIKLNLNWDEIIDDIDIKNNNFTHTSDNIPLATKIANNSNNIITEYK
jgi:hypothetical protein|tara:strand:+ start:474 stop:1355 length:882 start_codon:yes stop_codon:yes gene_type:complete